MAKAYVKFNNEETLIALEAYATSGSIVGLVYPNVKENLSGFIICDQDEEVIADCSDFKYRWDVLDDDPGRIYYSNSAENMQTKKFSTEDYVEEAEPLSNEELTEAVADLMYEISVAQLGL